MLKGLATYCHEHFNHEVNLRERIRILDDTESGEFWLYEPGRKFENRKKIKVGKHERDVPDFEDRAERGCLYVIDECHNYFPAREWQLTGNDATFFLSQHRKLNCDVILITQHPEQCDKALRRLAQEYMTVRNLSREPFLGFNLASWFGEFRFLRMLNSPQSGNPCIFDSGFVSLNTQEIGALYDTMQGVGIAGRVVAKREQRGRSLWWLLVPMAGFGLAAWMVLSHIRAINHAVASGLGKDAFPNFNQHGRGGASASSFKLLVGFLCLRQPPLHLGWHCMTSPGQIHRSRRMRFIAWDSAWSVVR